jgi:6-phosphofructokinase 1
VCLFLAQIHKRGGTILGSSRGGHDLEKIMAALIKYKVNQVYVVGGDGTHRGANLISMEAAKRQIPMTVAGVPKTIDNDVAFIDKSFGFDTAVEAATRVIQCASVEAQVLFLAPLYYIDDDALRMKDVRRHKICDE